MCEELPGWHAVVCGLGTDTLCPYLCKLGGCNGPARQLSTPVVNVGLTVLRICADISQSVQCKIAGNQNDEIGADVPGQDRQILTTTIGRQVGGLAQFTLRILECENGCG